MIRKYGFLAATVILAACSSESSSTVSTKSIHANFTADADESTNKTHFTAKFDEDFTDVVLSNGDKAQLTTDKDPTPIDLPRGDLKFYETDIQAIDRNTATFLFIRTSGTSAKNNTVTIPAPMVITAPAANSSVAYGGGTGKLTLSWSNPASNQGKVHIAPHDCNAAISASTGFDVDDNGSADLTTSQITVAAPTGPQCVKLFLMRQATGTEDPAFDTGGYATSSRNQIFQVNVTP
jgi:hypothetical protein